MGIAHTQLPAGAARRSLHTPAMIGIVLALWFAASTFVLEITCVAGLLEERRGTP